MKKRLNIGLFIDTVNNSFSRLACIGAENAAKRLDANLIIFPGHYIGIPDTRNGNMEYEYQYNTVFNLANENNLDVLFILMGIVGSRDSDEVRQEFLKRYPNLPIVTLFTKMDGYQSITFDNKSGFSQLVNHIIKDHGAKKIGYVSGPVTNLDAVERLEVFKECVADAGVELNEDYIVYGDFTDSSDKVVEELLDKAGKLDAIVFANDTMAIGGYRVLAKRGLVPGKDIIVTGFDDDSFAAGMTPPLTTVEANPADLVYQAVMKTEEFLSTGNISQYKVDTYLARRESCGCDKLDYEYMLKRLHLDVIKDGTSSFLDATFDYLFGVYNDDDNLDKIKEVFAEFDVAMVEALLSGMADDKVYHINKIGTKLFSMPILKYTTIRKVYDWLQVIQYSAEHSLETSEAVSKLAIQFSGFYRRLSYVDFRERQSDMERMQQVAGFGNGQMTRIYLNDHSEIPYESLLDGLSQIGIRRAYMYVFQGDTMNTNDERWKCPGTVLLKGVFDEDGVRSLHVEQELVRSEQMFDNENIKNERRQTMVVVPLFVGVDLYGMLVCELPIDILGSVIAISYQTSIALKTFKMIDEQQTIKRNLEASLEQIRKDNKTLNAISKSDELTGLYNRRGFLEYATSEIVAPKNLGKNAIICYFDMDNLKMVNDVYGHDEGDFALKEIASILNDAFRHTDIIGRFGGDEFVVFANVAVSNYEEKIKQRIREITKKHNNNVDKPYPIEMSTGVCEFVCGPDMDIYKLLESADEKLYTEKKSKKKNSYRNIQSGGQE